MTGEVCRKVRSAGLGELCVARAEGLIEVHGLGSCVAVCITDVEAAVAGVAHTVLPSRTSSTSKAGSGRFVDEAVPLLLRRVERLGADPGRLVARLVGGADILTLNGAGAASIGERNIEAARAALEERGVPIAAEDVGGTRGRRLTLDVATGLVTVRMAGGVSYEL